MCAIYLSVCVSYTRKCGSYIYDEMPSQLTLEKIIKATSQTLTELHENTSLEAF